MWGLHQFFVPQSREFGKFSGPIEIRTHPTLSSNQSSLLILGTLQLGSILDNGVWKGKSQAIFSFGSSALATHNFYPLGYDNEADNRPSSFCIFEYADLEAPPTGPGYPLRRIVYAEDDAAGEALYVYDRDNRLTSQQKHHYVNDTVIQGTVSDIDPVSGLILTDQTYTVYKICDGYTGCWD